MDTTVVGTVKRKTRDIAKIFGQEGEQDYILEIELAIEEAEQTIKNYCSITTVPDALRFVVANMATDILRYVYVTSIKQTLDVPEKELSTADLGSIQMGDTNISIATTQSILAQSADNKALQSRKPSLDQLVYNYIDALNQYRTFRW